MPQRRSWSYYLNIHYREQMQTVTIISVFFFLRLFFKQDEAKEKQAFPKS